jgi:hypothetical protein
MKRIERLGPFHGHFVAGVSSFKYQGRKTSFVDAYPAPRYPLIIEPFAGSASYAVRWCDRAAKLFDVDDDVATLWHWILAGCPSTDFRALELHRCASLVSTTVTSFKPSAEIARYLNRAQRLARVVAGRWSFEQATYQTAPDVEATWFIDPPYQKTADQYRAGALDYAELWRWCSTRKGQVILCEAADNDWIPEPVEVVATIRGGGLAGGKPRGGPRVEVMWHRPGAR